MYKLNNSEKILSVVVIVLMLTSCSIFKTDINYHKSWIKDTNSFDILMEQFAHNIENIWGFNKILIAGPKDYVKYTDSYKTRSHIDFENGVIFIETIANINPKDKLRCAIVKTLLMGDDSSFVDLYSDVEDIKISKNPFLYGQVLNQAGKPILLEKCAIDFANYLLSKHLKIINNGTNIIYSIKINLVNNHLDKRSDKYINIINKASNKYGIDKSLILAIIQIESSFNPYAVSNSDALGLMQIVQHTAGKDVFRTQGKSGKPSKNYLFNPSNNIDIGTAYLTMLNNTYLSGIIHPTSRRYAVITAYNSGVNSVLHVFSNNKLQAVKIINSMSPGDVYSILTTNHPSLESRRYLYKVNMAQKIYYRR